MTTQPQKTEIFLVGSITVDARCTIHFEPDWPLGFPSEAVAEVEQLNRNEAARSEIAGFSRPGIYPVYVTFEDGRLTKIDIDSAMPEDEPPEPFGVGIPGAPNPSEAVNAST